MMKIYFDVSTKLQSSSQEMNDDDIIIYMYNLLYSEVTRYDWPNLYQRRMTRLDELEQGKDSSSNNLSVYKRGKADGSSVIS